MPGLNMADLVQNANTEGEQAENGLGPEQHPTPVVAIGEGAADQAKGEGRYRPKDAV